MLVSAIRWASTSFLHCGVIVLIVPGVESPGNTLAGSRKGDTLTLRVLESGEIPILLESASVHNDGRN